MNAAPEQGPRPMQRADRVLVELGYAKSRTQAKSMIEAGTVTVSGVRIERASQLVSPSAEINVQKATQHHYVARSAVKLLEALDHFDIDAAVPVGLDVGASTGGFTQVLLERGAQKVFAVDVGHDQLDESVRQDARVVAIERCNAKDLSHEQVPQPANIIVCDVSFISLTLILPTIVALAAADATLIALIKPQFEAGKKSVRRGGVVKDAHEHELACKRVSDCISQQEGWVVVGIIESPITGAKGNREFLICARRRG